MSFKLIVLFLDSNKQNNLTLYGLSVYVMSVRFYEYEIFENNLKDPKRLESVTTCLQNSYLKADTALNLLDSLSSRLKPEEYFVVLCSGDYAYCYDSRNWNCNEWPTEQDSDKWLDGILA